MTKITKKHPRDDANILSHFFFLWQLKLVIKKLRNKEIVDDICVKNQESTNLGDVLEAQWNKEKQKKTPSLLFALFKLFGAEFLLYGIFYFPVDVIIVGVQSYCLGQLLDYFVPNQEATSVQNVYIYGFAVTSVSFLRVFNFHFYTIQSCQVGLKIKIACSSLVYRKLLEMKTNTIRNVTLGNIINLLSNDMERFDRIFSSVQCIWITPLRLILIIVYLNRAYSYTAIIGTGGLFLGLLLQVYVFKQIVKYKLKISSIMDHRIRMMHVLVSGIQSVKMYTWEKPMAKLVNYSRRLELLQITKSNFFKMMNSSSSFYLGKLAFFLCILPVVISGQPLTSKYIFTLVSIYDMMMYLIRFLVSTLPLFSEIMVAFQRIQNFLLLEQGQESCVYHNEQVGVKAKDMSLKWDQLRVLDGVDFCVGPGELVAVVGVAGCGKTTLLQAILSEIQPESGTLLVGGRISYAPQEPCIISATIKDNILFGEKMDQLRYNEVVRVCALEHDYSLFAYGDNTLVGERGVKLSGGQKARISLARAVYRDADLYLIDDPLSGVDSRVAKHIYDECMLKYLRDKSIVLVTHQVQYLQQVDRIYVIQERKMQVENWNTTFQNLEANKKTQIPKGNFTETEVEIKEDASGTIINPYKSYFSAGGYKRTCLQLLFFVLVQFLLSSQDYVLSIWDHSSVYIYSSLLVVVLVLSNLNSLAFALYGQHVTHKLHDSLFDKVLRGSMQFFNNHSSGRILNRFSQDLGIVDDVIPYFLFDTIQYCLFVIATVVLIVIVNYWMILPTVVLFALLLTYTFLFRSTMHQLKMTESIHRSPIFTHISTTVQSSTVIKAFKAQEHMKLQFDRHQNVHSSSRYLFRAVYFCLSFWTDLTCAVYIVVVIQLLLLLDSDNNGRKIGLAISQSICLIGPTQYLAKQWSEMDMMMTSVGRVVEYVDLKSEEDHGRFIPLDTWPSQGNVAFRSVSMRYCHGKPLVLKQVTLNIKAGEKIGIVGRTGAGKSSLVCALFRLFDFDGLIFIDGVSTKSVPLSILRSRILTIPQEPVLFLGTLRQNLDPFDTFKDEELWNALAEIELKQWVSCLPLGLETQVLEGGSNFSVGERQLLCLCRVILKKAQIVVLDEATANIDSKTDEMIQATIKRKFGHATVLTIAHRLNTVMDSDRIIVMNEGVVVEFSSPKELLENPNSYFYKSVHQVN